MKFGPDIHCMSHSTYVRVRRREMCYKLHAEEGAGGLAADVVLNEG